MQELIEKLTTKVGISEEQAAKVLDTIKEFVKEKFPMMAGAVDNLLPTEGGSNAPANISLDKNSIGPDILD